MATVKSFPVVPETPPRKFVLEMDENEARYVMACLGCFSPQVVYREVGVEADFGKNSEDTIYCQLSRFLAGGRQQDWSRAVRKWLSNRDFV